MNLRINESSCSLQFSALLANRKNTASLQNPSQEALVIKVCKFLLDCLFSPFIFIYRLLTPTQQKPLILIQKKEVTILEKITPIAIYQQIAKHPKAVKTAMMSVAGLIGGYAYYQYFDTRAVPVELESSFNFTTFAIPALVVTTGVVAGLYYLAFRLSKEIQEQTAMRKIVSDFEKEIAPYLTQIIAKCAYKIPREINEVTKGKITDITEKFNSQIAKKITSEGFSVEAFLRKTLSEQREELFLDLHKVMNEPRRVNDEKTFWYKVSTILIDPIASQISQEFSERVKINIQKSIHTEKRNLTEVFEVILKGNISSSFSNFCLIKEQRQSMSTESKENQYYQVYNEYCKIIARLSTLIGEKNEGLMPTSNLASNLARKKFYKKHHVQLKELIDSTLRELGSDVQNSSALAVFAKET